MGLNTWGINHYISCASRKRSVIRLQIAKRESEQLLKLSRLMKIFIARSNRLSVNFRLCQQNAISILMTV